MLVVVVFTLALNKGHQNACWISTLKTAQAVVCKVFDFQLKYEPAIRQEIIMAASN